MFLRADREGDIDRPCRGDRGKSIDRKREKEGERRYREWKKDNELGERGREKARWIGEGRRQPARRMPLLAAVKFWDRLDSVESGQPSGRRHSSSRCPRSAFFRGITSRSSGPRVFRYVIPPLFSTFLLLFPSALVPTAFAVAHGSSSSPDNQAYPEARARARAREPVVLLVRLLYDRRTRVSAASRSRELPVNFRER